MKTFKCVVMRTQYQTVEVEAEDYDRAEELARYMFDPDNLIESVYDEVYDIEEIGENHADDR